MNDDEKKKVLKWKLILDTPFKDKQPDNKCEFLSLYRIGDHDIIAGSVYKDIPVTHKGQIVGVCSEGIIKFFDTPEGKAAVNYINKIDGPIGISSKKMGTINPDGSITEGPVFEQ